MSSARHPTELKETTDELTWLEHIRERRASEAQEEEYRPEKHLGRLGARWGSRVDSAWQDRQETGRPGERPRSGSSAELEKRRRS